MYCEQLNQESDAFDRLPRECATWHITTGESVLLKRGQKGYWPLHPATDVERFNRDRGISEAQLAAMEIGSAFGFDVPGADPAMHNDDTGGGNE